MPGKLLLITYDDVMYLRIEISKQYMLFVNKIFFSVFGSIYFAKIRVYLLNFNIKHMIILSGFFLHVKSNSHLYLNYF